jgi:hypothetical protein
MFDSYVIEIDEIDAGLLLRHGRGYVFHAVADLFRSFEGVWFSDPSSAERALRRGLRAAGARPSSATAALGRDHRAG